MTTHTVTRQTLTMSRAPGVYGGIHSPVTYVASCTACPWRFESSVKSLADRHAVAHHQPADPITTKRRNS